MGYDVYLYNIPRVGEDGKPIGIAPHQTQGFSQLEDAQKFAAENKDKFDRVVVMHTAGDKPKLMERFMDGEHSVPEIKEEDTQEEVRIKEEDTQEEVN